MVELLFFRKIAHNLHGIDQNPRSSKEYFILAKSQSLRKESSESRYQLRMISRTSLYIFSEERYRRTPKAFCLLVVRFMTEFGNSKNTHYQMLSCFYTELFP